MCTGPESKKAESEGRENTARANEKSKYEDVIK